MRSAVVTADADAASAPPLLTGIRILSRHLLQHAHHVLPTDILEVDFDNREPGTGLYVVEEIGPRGIEWQGCRLFDRRPTITGKCGLWMDYTGEKDWRPVDLAEVGWRVIGCVLHVYRRTQ